MLPSARLLPFAAALCLGLASAADAAGRIAGRINHVAGGGVAGVVVVVNELGVAEVTDASGAFTFERVPPASYSLTMTLGRASLVATPVEVVDGRTTRLERSVDWAIPHAETITVTGASRRVERSVEAPASVSVVGAESIARESVHGQLPRLFEALPGVDVAQASLSDFNVNARGFNSNLSRRVLTRLDGRDPSNPLQDSQTWSSLRWDVEELASVEFIRGPSSALYGANAFNGVINLTSLEPRASLGTRVRLQGGEFDTAGVSVRHAGPLGNDVYYRVRGGYEVSEDFARSRVGAVEYAPGQLPQEVVPPPLNQARSGFVESRVDRYFDNGDQLTLEARLGGEEGQTILTTISRVQYVDSKRGFARAAYRLRGWDLRASYDVTRLDTVILATGLAGINDSNRLQLELLRPFAFGGDRLRLVAGASYRYRKLDTADDQGHQTLLRAPQGNHEGALFGQADLQATARLKLVLAGRLDESDLYAPELSPKIGAVYTLTPAQTLRATYSRAFKAANLSERFQRVSVAPPLDLSGLEAALAPALGGVPLGLGNIPVRVLGNADLDVEKNKTLELGYSALIGGKALLSVDLYRSQIEDFISGTLPQVGTSLGRINPAFGPYRPPSELTSEQAALVLAGLREALPPQTFARLSNDLDGSPIVASRSSTNIGKVATTGTDIGLRYFVDRRWSLDLSGSWFHYDVEQDPPESPIVPNTPRYKVGLGIGYAAPRFDASLRGHWVDAHTWSSGVFSGPIPSYSIVDLASNCRVSSLVTVGINVRNLFDHQHWQAFGGDLIGRRALAYVSFAW